MYEHVYQVDYGVKAGDYVEAYMKAIRRGACRPALQAITRA